MQTIKINIIALILIVLTPCIISILKQNNKRILYLSVDSTEHGFRFNHRDSTFILTEGRINKDLNFIYLLEKHKDCKDSYAIRPSTSSKFVAFLSCRVNLPPTLGKNKPTCLNVDKEDNKLRNVNHQPLFFKKDKNNLCLLGIDDYEVDKVDVYEIDLKDKNYGKVSKNIENFEKNKNNFNSNLRKDSEINASYQKIISEKNASDQKTINILRMFEALTLKNEN